MKIYTKKGDKGMTSLYDGTQLPKSHNIFRCLSEFDMLTTNIGVLITVIQSEIKSTIRLNSEDPIITDLHDIQKLIQHINSNIATVNEEKKKKLTKIDVSNVEFLENRIDEMTKELPPLTVFILPGGCVNSAFAHVCRVQARKAESALWDLDYLNSGIFYGYHIDEEIFQFMNRLSDYFFTLARYLDRL